MHNRSKLTGRRERTSTGKTNRSQTKLGTARTNATRKTTQRPRRPRNAAVDFTKTSPKMKQRMTEIKSDLVNRMFQKSVAHGHSGKNTIRWFWQLYRDMDTNHDGMISTDEFVNAMKEIHLPEDSVNDLIRRFDSNGDGVISPAEFRDVLLKADAHEGHATFLDIKRDSSLDATKMALKRRMDGLQATIDKFEKEKKFLSEMPQRNQPYADTHGVATPSGRTPGGGDYSQRWARSHMLSLAAAGQELLRGPKMWEANKQQRYAEAQIDVCKRDRTLVPYQYRGGYGKATCEFSPKHQTTARIGFGGDTQASYGSKPLKNTVHLDRVTLKEVNKERRRIRETTQKELEENKLMVRRVKENIKRMEAAQRRELHESRRHGPDAPCPPPPSLSLSLARSLACSLSFGY